MVSATSRIRDTPHGMAGTTLDPWRLGLASSGHEALPSPLHLNPAHASGPGSQTQGRPQGSKMVSATSAATETPHDMAETILNPLAPLPWLPGACRPMAQGSDMVAATSRAGDIPRDIIPDTWCPGLACVKP